MAELALDLFLNHKYFPDNLYIPEHDTIDIWSYKRNPPVVIQCCHKVCKDAYICSILYTRD